MASRTWMENASRAAGVPATNVGFVTYGFAVDVVRVLETRVPTVACGKLHKVAQSLGLQAQGQVPLSG